MDAGLLTRLVPVAFRVPWLSGGALLIHVQPVFAHALLIDTKVKPMIYCIGGAASHLHLRLLLHPSLQREMEPRTSTY